MPTCSITDDIVIDNPAAIDQMNPLSIFKRAFNDGEESK